MTEITFQNGEQISRTLETIFKDVHLRRMKGVAIINSALEVQALPFIRFQRHWIGVLITPWSMNLVLLPEAAEDWQGYGPGESIEITFPFGEFVFTVAFESQLGLYALCSLYSPMLQFKQQQLAVVAAQSALTTLFEESRVGDEKRMSRRQLLRGRFAERPENS